MLKIKSPFFLILFALFMQAISVANVSAELPHHSHSNSSEVASVEIQKNSSNMPFEDSKNMQHACHGHCASHLLMGTSFAGVMANLKETSPIFYKRILSSLSYEPDSPPPNFS